MRKCLSLVAMIGLLSFVGCGGGDGDNGDNMSDGSPTTRPEITLAQYNAITLGMSYGDVCSILGGQPLVTEIYPGDGTEKLCNWTSSNEITAVYVWFKNNTASTPSAAGMFMKSGQLRVRPGQVVVMADDTVLVYLDL